MVDFMTEAGGAIQPQTTQTRFVDWLLVFPSLNTVPSSRDREWVKVKSPSDCAELYHAPCVRGGTPFLHACEMDRWCFWLIGELVSVKNDGQPQSMPSLLKEIGKGIVEKGEVNPETANGHFILFGFERTPKRWHVWTSRLGTFHAYHATDGLRSAVGTFSGAVADAASRRKLDWVGISGFFCFGFFPEDRTHFQDLRILRPASHYIFDETGKKIHAARYWEWFHRPDSRRSFSDTLEFFGSTLKGVLRSYPVTPRLALPISGGLDSRTLAAAMTEENDSRPGHLWAYAYGYTANSAETAIAERVARKRDIPFDGFTIGPYLFDRISMILKCTEGFQDVTSTRQAGVFEHIANHADYLMAGHWGDVWLDHMIGPKTEGRRYDDHSNEISRLALHKVRKRGWEWLSRYVCQPNLRTENPDEILHEMVRNEIDGWSHVEDPDFRMKIWKTEQWSFRWTCASLRMFLPGAFIRLPFYDARMVDFFCSVPTAFVKNRCLQVDYLKRYHPDLAQITWEVTDSSLFHRQYYHSWLLPKRAVKKIMRCLSGTRHIGRNWEVQFLNRKGREGLDHWLLREGLKIHEWVDPSEIRRLRDDVLGHPNAANGYALSMLLTFSAWLEHFG